MLGFLADSYLLCTGQLTLREVWFTGSHPFFSTFDS